MRLLKSKGLRLFHKKGGAELESQTWEGSTDPREAGTRLVRALG